MRTKHLLPRLKRFLKELREPQDHYSQNCARVDYHTRAELRAQEEKLSRMFGQLEPYILKFSTTKFNLSGTPLNPWRSAFVLDPPIVKSMSLETVIREMNRIIGHYESIGREEVLLENIALLFDSLKLHPRVINTSRRRFMDGHYADAIFAAFKEVNLAVQEASGRNDLDGKTLMDHAFSPDRPRIKLTNLSNPTERDEQLGFMLIFGGATMGIRNPKAHTNVVQSDPYKTLEYLGLASLLLKRLDERVQQP